jgi:hypothetical protein
MALTTQLKEIIQAEIINDPGKRHYTGKTSEEIAELINNPYETELILKQQNIARINQCFLGIAYAPNAVTAEEIQEILNG